MPEKTIGCAGLYPGSASAAEFSASVTVSPTRVSATFLMLAVMYPTSPALKTSQGSNPTGRICPISTTRYSAPVPIIRTVISRRSRPSIRRMYTMTPRYASYWLSKISARRGFSGSPLGAGRM
jgi:hypothetical protein